tara:strand:+ start:8317 stop:8508 length:192 start_codon:yes stop_codon:yes gene_type:complete
MYEELINSNNSLSGRIKELELELKQLKAKYECVKAFAKGVSFNSPIQYEKLREEIKRIESEET